jgi:hypothetical protein
MDGVLSVKLMIGALPFAPLHHQRDMHAQPQLTRNRINYRLQHGDELRCGVLLP